jgi:FkbM family methyltransferase
MKCNDAFLLDSVHEANLLALLDGKRFRVTLDVGAHCGLWTRALARVSDRVYAYEPHPVAYADLLETCKGSTTFLINAACWITPCRMMLNCFEHPSHSTLLNVHPIPNSAGPMVSGYEVQTVRLDDEFAETIDRDRIDFIKIDTEGSEVQVMLGAEKIFSRPLLYLIECHTPETLKIVREILKDGRELGYSTARYWSNL